MTGTSSNQQDVINLKFMAENSIRNPEQDVINLKFMAENSIRNPDGLPNA